MRPFESFSFFVFLISFILGSADWKITLANYVGTIWGAPAKETSCGRAVGLFCWLTGWPSLDIKKAIQSEPKWLMQQSLYGPEHVPLSLHVHCRFGGHSLWKKHPHAIHEKTASACRTIAVLSLCLLIIHQGLFYSNSQPQGSNACVPGGVQAPC